MVDPVTFRIWVQRTLFVLIALVVILRGLLPLGPEAPLIPGPDLVLCFIFTWILRQPTAVPAWLIVTVVLLMDFVLLRPPGLWALMVLIGSEVMRRQAYRDGETPFLVEYGIVALTIAAMMIGQRIILFVLFLDQPPLGATLLHLLTTVVCYPIVVVFSMYLLGIRKSDKTQTGLQGART